MLLVINSLWSYVYCFIRPVIKWFLRKTTKLCELQRICYGDERGAKRTCNIEWSLSMSRQPTIKYVVSQLNCLAERGRFTQYTSRSAVDYAVGIVADVKDINTFIHRQFVISFHMCLLQIFGYKQLIYEIENLRQIQYSPEDHTHEAKLLQGCPKCHNSTFYSSFNIPLWSKLQPDNPLISRISRQWTDIGFQGDDPKTDFRGMGLLGLENLLYFAAEYHSTAKHVLSHSSHPVYGYSFAIVGINLTKMTYQLLITDKLKNHLFNTVKGRPQVRHFHQTYCYIFYEFDKFWLKEKPQDIMEFNRIRDKFEEHLLNYLSKPTAALKLNVVIETL